jgi:hypothetical protein
MPTYEYSCISDGALEIVAPMEEGQLQKAIPEAVNLRDFN